jgi:putative membrane protein
VNGISGYQFWGMWVLLIVGTAAFWALISLAVRALYTGGDTSGSQTSDHPRTLTASQAQIRLQERLARGEITAEEYAHFRAEVHTDSGRPRS